jgi:hypothetical protein
MMPEVSAAIVAVAGAVLIMAGVLPSQLTDTSRQRLAGIGYLLVGFGLLAWLIAFVMQLVRLGKAM